MQIVGHFDFLLIFFSVIEFHKRVFGKFLGFVYMDCVSWFKFLSQTCDFGCGFLVFGCFRQLFNLVFVILFFNLGLRLFQFGFYSKGLSKKLQDFGVKSSDFRENGMSLLEMEKKSDAKMKISKRVSNIGVENDSGDSGDGEGRNVDEVFDVLSLRSMVKRERQRADDIYSELEKERTSSATAADEAMAMIHRLQNEKCVVEMEAKQYRRLADEKQIHDQEVIQSLRWIVMKHESERSYMDDHLKFYKRRLKSFSKGGDVDMCEENGEPTSLFNSSTDKSLNEHSDIGSLDYISKILVKEERKYEMCKFGTVRK